MKKLYALIAILGLLVAGPAFAGWGNGGTPPGQDKPEGTNIDVEAEGGDGGTVFGSGNSSSRADGGDATSSASGGDAYSGSMAGAAAGAVSGAGVFDSGNSNSYASSYDTLVNDQGQQQGQQQGQNTAVDQVLSSHNHSNQDTDVATDNDQATEVNVDASDRSSQTYNNIEKRRPVHSAANVYATACSSGVSGQFQGFGGSLAKTNPMCDIGLAIGFARDLGTAEGDAMVVELTLRGVEYAKARTNKFKNFCQKYLPFIGNLM